ncbi:MAG: hypothetical protein HY002_09630 [Candidatus Rokubacteria bacterium]|nr:hypothetical protein [Candidatus Rokubacteria bacterium]
MERLARLFVGIGFLWMALVLAVALLGGLDTPSTYFKLLVDVTGFGWLHPVYLGLAVIVVPVGMLTFLLDILGDPVALWVKWAAPGAFLAVYVFFLLAAMPEVGRPFFLGLESVVAPIAGTRQADASAGSTASWLIRFGVTFAVFAGIPGVIGAVLGLVSGSKSGARGR